MGGTKALAAALPKLLYSHHWEIEIYLHMRNIFFITGKFLGFVKKLSEKK